MVKKKVLIIGATGMLGHVVYNYLEQLDKYSLFNSVYRTKLTDDSIICNVKDENALKQLFLKTKPDVVLNCVGALIKESREDPTSAIYLNGLFPNILKKYSDEHNAKLIHISTDCVFSGSKGSYLEDDFRDADDLYGRSKAIGEIFDAPHCTLRTSIIGPELKENGTGLFHWFMQQTGEIKGYTKVYWNGVTTLELAKAIEKAIANDLKGLLHVTNGKKISKFDLLNLLNQFKTKQLQIIPFDDYESDKSLKSSDKFDFEVPEFEKMIAEIQF
jgi:dTDP-4-dehydrorhamnose reductase